jgi:chromate transport protein ChrA
MQENQSKTYSINKGEKTMSFTMSAMMVTMLASYILPAVVAIITKISAATWFKQLISGLLAAVTGLLATATQMDGTAVFSSQSLLLALGAFILSQATYVSVYKPNDAAGRLMPGKGLG